jgi:phosphoglycolate phosphatase
MIAPLAPARIVFDLDGTLIDSAPDIHAIANRVLSEEGAAPLGLEEAKSFVGNGAPVFIERMRAARGLAEARQDALLARFVGLYDRAHDLTRPYPGVIAALDALREAGHRLGICTNKPVAPARSVLAHLEFDPYFEIVLGGDSLPTRKPDPAPLMACFEALGTGACLYVGDSEVDADTALRAGIPFLLFTEGYRKAPVAALPHRARFDAFDTLPGLVADCLSAP